MVKTNWRYIPFGTFTGAKNMAIDETLLNEVGDNQIPNVLRFYKWSPSTASIGQHQSLSAEIDVEATQQLGVDVVRRISGGGAVFHDFSGEITYAVIFHNSDLPHALELTHEYDESIPLRYQIILEALAQGLESLGIPIDSEKIHCPALLTAGKKLSGNAQAIRKGSILQHGTILLRVDPELMYLILKAPIGTDYTRMIKSVRAKVTGILQDEGIESSLRNSLSEETIITALRSGFEHVFQTEFKEDPLSSAEWEMIHKLIQTKYANPIWLNKFP